MFFRIWFISCKLFILLGILLLVSLAAESWVPEVTVLRMAFWILIPIAVWGGVLSLLLQFGMRLQCPSCKGRETTFSGRGNFIFLECKNCGKVGGNIFGGWKLHVEPFEEDNGPAPPTG